MKLYSVMDETYCLKTQRHLSNCNGKNHFCYRCGLLLGPCDCPALGSPLDY
ncbi:MAG: hypothetical protein HYU03_01405 [Thaumarchaeota archaeon]|nr:hypothetical protein [Nitrososphaerota archaeon]MCS4539334.1 hypothetical protein [Nitrososphaerota archaeon]